MFEGMAATRSCSLSLKSSITSNIRLLPSSMRTRLAIAKRTGRFSSRSLVQWVVTATAGSKDGHRRGLLAAYADPRAYMDRLNQLLTPSGWTQEYSTQVVANCPRKVRDKQAASAKLLVVCRLTVFGLGVHSGTGEGWADDENALTSADAQAFKRARRVLRSRPLLLRSTADMGGSGRARSSKVVAGVAGVGPAAGDARQGEWKRRS